VLISSGLIHGILIDMINFNFSEASTCKKFDSNYWFYNVNCDDLKIRGPNFLWITRNIVSEGLLGIW